MLSLHDIIIDPEIETLIPPLTDDERTQLMVNIQRDGFRDPLVVWLGHGILLDGHNRYRIWEAVFEDDENREPTILEMKFATRDDAKLWVIKNQLGRRNLTDAQRVMLALQLKPSLQAKAKDNQKSGGSTGGKSDTKGSQNSVKASEKVDVQKDIAKAAGVSHDTVHKVETVLRDADDQTKAEMLANKVSIHAAHRKTVASALPIGTSPRRLKSLTDSDVNSTRFKIRGEVERLLNRIKRTSKGAIETLPGLQRDLERLADECLKLAAEVAAKREG